MYVCMYVCMPNGRDIATALKNGEASVPTFALTARISLPIVPFALFATAISEIAPGPIGIVSSPPLHDFVNSDVDIVSDADEEFIINYI